MADAQPPASSAGESIVGHGRHAASNGGGEGVRRPAEPAPGHRPWLIRRNARRGWNQRRGGARNCPRTAALQPFGGGAGRGDHRLSRLQPSKARWPRSAFQAVGRSRQPVTMSTFPKLCGTPTTGDATVASQSMISSPRHSRRSAGSGALSVHRRNADARATRSPIDRLEGQGLAEIIAPRPQDVPPRRADEASTGRGRCARDRQSWRRSLARARIEVVEASANWEACSVTRRSYRRFSRRGVTQDVTAEVYGRN